MLVLWPFPYSEYCISVPSLLGDSFFILSSCVIPGESNSAVSLGRVKRIGTAMKSLAGAACLEDREAVQILGEW